MSKMFQAEGGRGQVDAVARLRAIEVEAHEQRVRLERQLAKGTRDMPVMPNETVSVNAKIEVALRGAERPLRMFELVRAVGLPVATVLEATKRMRVSPCPTRHTEQAPDAKMIYNHGASEDPQWGWVIGDQTPTRELYAAIEAMLRRRPYSFAELTNATGARRGRVSGATIEFSRAGLPIFTVGDSLRHYEWYIGSLADLPTDLRRKAEPVRLDPDKTKV